MHTIITYVSEHKLFVLPLASFLIGFIGITALIANASLVFYYVVSDTSTNFGSQLWREFGHRYTLWLMIPPPLRPTCEWVDTEVCRLTGTIHDASSWQQYIGNLLAAAVFTLVILATGFIIRWLGSRLIEMVRGSSRA